MRPEADNMPTKISQGHAPIGTVTHNRWLAAKRVEIGLLQGKDP